MFHRHFPQAKRNKGYCHSVFISKKSVTLANPFNFEPLFFVLYDGYELRVFFSKKNQQDSGPPSSEKVFCRLMFQLKCFVLETLTGRKNEDRLSRPAPGRDYSCCSGVPGFKRGRGHGRPKQS